jgi:hypothetical protein
MGCDFEVKVADITGPPLTHPSTNPFSSSTKKLRFMRVIGVTLRCRAYPAWPSSTASSAIASAPARYAPPSGGIISSAGRLAGHAIADIFSFRRAALPKISLPTVGSSHCTPRTWSSWLNQAKLWLARVKRERDSRGPDALMADLLYRPFHIRCSVQYVPQGAGLLAALGRPEKSWRIVERMRVAKTQDDGILQLDY